MLSRNLNVRVAASVVGCLATLASLTACGGGSAGPASSGATTTDVAAATTTSEATTTTVLATTTTEPPIPLTLRPDGLGPFDFDTDPIPVIEAITEQFGEPISDVNAEFLDTIPNEDGRSFLNADHTRGLFDGNFTRTVCWPGMCALFKGADELTTLFAGWRYEEGASVSLARADGLTVGSRLSDIPAVLEAAEYLHPCFFPDGSPGHDGELWLQEDERSQVFTATFRSEGIPFTYVNSDADAIRGFGISGPMPPPDLTVVKRLRAGEWEFVHPRGLYCTGQ